METHAHDLHKAPGHGWKHYFFEFFMLFLAVSVGFFVENIREHISDKEKEKQNIGTIITAIASDTTQLNYVIHSNKVSLSYLSQFIKLRNADLSKNQTKQEFYDDAANGSFNDVYFRSNDAAFQQLQTSGTLRLISKKGIIDSLFQYQHNSTLISRIEADHYYFSKLVWEGMSKLIDVTYTLNSFDTVTSKYDVEAGIYKVPQGTELFFDYDKKTVNKIFNDASTLALNSDVYAAALRQQLAYGKMLIGLLKKEYHLDEE